MVEVIFSIESSLPPERVLAVATDFSPRRPEVWSGIDPARYEVHALGATWADVTEGGSEPGGIWSRERYDWSAPGTVRAEVLESNVFQPGSYWELQVNQAESGGSKVEWRSLRHPNGPKGLILVAILAVAGRRHLTKYLRRTLASSSPSAVRGSDS